MRSVNVLENTKYNAQLCLSKTLSYIVKAWFINQISITHQIQIDIYGRYLHFCLRQLIFNFTN